MNEWVDRRTDEQTDGCIFSSIVKGVATFESIAARIRSGGYSSWQLMHDDEAKLP